MIGQQLLQRCIQGQSTVDRVAIGTGKVAAADVELGAGLTCQQHQRLIQGQGRHVEIVIAAMGLGVGGAGGLAGLDGTDRGGIGDQGQRG
ncbi:hypothetical protein D3C77_720690 [compost metagenome]